MTQHWLDSLSRLSPHPHNRYTQEVANKEESHGMVRPENIDSGRSNSQLGDRSRCRHCNLIHLLSSHSLKHAAVSSTDQGGGKRRGAGIVIAPARRSRRAVARHRGRRFRVDQGTMSAPECAHCHRLSPGRGAGMTSPSGLIPFRNLKRSLPVERTRVVFSAMMDL